MMQEPSFASVLAQVREFIQHASNPVETKATIEFEPLAQQLFTLQFRHNNAYRRFCLGRGATPETVRAWTEIPAVPAGAFKELKLTSLSKAEVTKVFHSSGTTGQSPSRHLHSAESLALYESSLRPWFERHLLGDLGELVEEQLIGPLDRLPFLTLTPAPEAAPHSSLAHMLDTVRRECGARDSLFAGRVNPDGTWSLDLESALYAIRKSMCANRPLVLLGTAFNFVHLLDHFAANNMRYRLARGSRVMETGGYKGQSREVPKAELHALIHKHLGLEPECIVTEYGMSELSSQAYDRVAARPHLTPALSPPSGSGGGEHILPASRTPGLPVFRFPPWCRVQVISPEHGREVAEGETGLLRVFDLANVRSVMAIQTGDLAVRRGDGFELLGRAIQSEPRGCSLMSLGPDNES